MMLSKRPQPLASDGKPGLYKTYSTGIVNVMKVTRFVSGLAVKTECSQVKK